MREEISARERHESGVRASNQVDKKPKTSGNCSQEYSFVENVATLFGRISVSVVTCACLCVCSVVV